MKWNTFQTLLRTAVALIVLTDITTTVTVAEVPRKTAAALQNRSPEKLLIEAQTVERKRNGAGGFDLEINARVLEVEKSETELTKGDSLTIRYWLHDPEKPLPSGSYPSEIEKGKKYRAYLGPPARAYRHLDDKESTIYFPTAASGSFEASTAFPRYAAEPVDLFDGKTLNGWARQGGRAEFRVEDGMIIGKTVKNAGNTFLCTTKHYADFDLAFKTKFLGKPVNSGCVIRALVRKEDGEKRYMKKGSVYGPQVEIEASGPKGSESGSIYGQGLGTDFLKPKKGRVKAIKDTQWNHIRILAKGPRIRTWINGEAIIDLTNRDIFEAHSSGMIGLQVHGVKNFTQPQEIAWKNIKITELTQ